MLKSVKQSDLDYFSLLVCLALLSQTVVKPGISKVKIQTIKLSFSICKKYWLSVNIIESLVKEESFHGVIPSKMALL